MSYVQIFGSDGNDLPNTAFSLYFPFDNRNLKIDAKGGNDLIASGGGADWILAGAGNDSVESGSGNDRIYGGGGADKMRGGTGDDFIDGGSDAGDIAQYADGIQYYRMECHNGKINIAHTRLVGGFLSDGSDVVVNVEFLTFYDFNGSSQKVTYSVDKLLSNGTIRNFIDGTSGGNTLAGGKYNDIVRGFSGDDKLSGAAGSDTLVGGAGRDVFIFNSKIGASNVDAVTDFSVRDDTIWLDQDIFTKVGKLGDLGEQAFHIGTNAHDPSDRIIYDKLSGALYYDADGTGRASSIQFAILPKGLTLTAADFDVIA